jgi:hypothetical protein
LIRNIGIKEIIIVFLTVAIMSLSIRSVDSALLYAVYAQTNASWINNRITNLDQDNSTLQISMKKQIYLPGEKINITIMNKGENPLFFKNSALGLNIQNIKNNEKIRIISLAVITELKANQSKTIQVDQINAEGKQSQSGIYNASVSSISIPSNPSVRANTTFIIDDV